jgi:hypothetical protein
MGFQPLPLSSRSARPRQRVLPAPRAPPRLPAHQSHARDGPPRRGVSAFPRRSKPSPGRPRPGPTTRVGSLRRLQGSAALRASAQGPTPPPRSCHPNRVSLPHTRAGASSCEHRRRASSRATSSWSRARSCAATTCSSSSLAETGGLAGRLHEESHRRVGDPAGAKPRTRLLRTGHPVSDPRPRQQVQRCLRPGVPQRGYSDSQDTGPSTQGERDCRALRAHRACRVFGLAADPQPHHLERVLRVYVDHYNRERPHPSLGLQPPERDAQPKRPAVGAIYRRDLLVAD